MKVDENRVKHLAEIMENLFVKKMQEADVNCLMHFEELSKKELSIVDFIGKKGEVIMRDIAEYLQAPVSTLTTIVDKLVAKRILDRYRSEEDRRIVKVVLGKEGHAAYQEYRVQKLNMSRSMLAAISEADQETLIRIFKEISVNLRKVELVD